jgi:hypothetical protein
MSDDTDDLGERWAEELRQAAGDDGPDRSDQSWLHDDPDDGLPFTWEHDYPAIKAPETVVQDLIERGALVEIFGESNSGKSTFALDIALAVGRPGAKWRDRVTTHGVVLWIALESAAGLRRRVVAFRKHHAIDGRMLFADITVPVRLLDIKDVDAIIYTAKLAATIADQPIQLIVVDTVHRALAGGDENDGRDMGTLVRGCDLIRQQTGAAVLLIHHCGKDSTRGARGHSSLRAAVDTEIEVSGQANPRTAKVTKQRDLPGGEALAFDLEPVEVATDPVTGQPVTACVVVHGGDAPKIRKAPSGKNQQAMLGAIRQWVAEHGAIIATPNWHALCKAQGLAKSRWSETREALVRDGWLVETIGGVRYEP